MIFLRSLPQSFRALEWILLTAYLGMWWSVPGYNFAATLNFWVLFFLLSWLFPLDLPRWLRLIYIVLGLLTFVWAKSLGIDFTLFPYIYFAKSYFLLGHRSTIWLIVVMVVPWTVSEYLGEVHRFQQSIGLDPIGLNLSNPIRFIVFTIAIYTAASFFTVMLSQMIVVQQKSDQKIEELTEQVESLAATLERTRIAREIHDSLGHTLTDLDTQLAVAQTLRSHNLDRAFEAVDTAKLLARQCIEDVSQALNRMRESNFDLNQALIALLEQLRQTSTVQVQWKVNLPPLPIYPSSILLARNN